MHNRDDRALPENLFFGTTGSVSPELSASASDAGMLLDADHLDHVRELVGQGVPNAHEALRSPTLSDVGARIQA